MNSILFCSRGLGQVSKHSQAKELAVQQQRQHATYGEISRIPVYFNHKLNAALASTIKKRTEFQDLRNKIGIIEDKSMDQLELIIQVGGGLQNDIFIVIYVAKRLM